MDWALLPNMFLDDEHSDVTLNVESEGSNKQLVVPAHSLVLKLASPVFKAMLEDEKFVEGKTKTVTIKAKGDTHDALIFLRYLYTREMDNLDMSAYISIMQTAHLYLVDSLVNLCSERIVAEATPLNICRVYAMLADIASEDLLMHCKNLMLRYAFMIFNRNLHWTLGEDVMQFLFSSDDCNVLDETQALEALWRWGCAKHIQGSGSNKNTNQQIENLLHLIRWPLVKNVSESSPWFGLWKTFSAATENGDASDTTSVGRTRAMPNLGIQISNFAEIFLFENVGNPRTFISKANTNSTICGSVEFLVDRFIMLTGLSFYVGLENSVNLEYELQFDGNQIAKNLFSLGPTKTIFRKNYDIFRKVGMDLEKPLRVDKFTNHSIEIFHFNGTANKLEFVINDFSYTRPEPTNSNAPRLTLLGRSLSICELRYLV